MGAEWVVVELTPRGEKESPDLVRQSARRLLGKADVYIPVIETKIGDDAPSNHYLISGYAFIRKERPDRDYLKLEDTRLFQSVLKRGRDIALVDTSYIETMKERARVEVNQGIGVGDIVLIRSGPYKAIEASVITEIPEERAVQVFIELRSKQSIITLPRSALKIVDRAPLSLYYARLGNLRSWAKMAFAAFTYASDFAALELKYSTYRFVRASYRSIQLLFYFIHAYPGGRTVDGLTALHGKIVEHYTTVSRLEAWQAKGRAVFNLVNFDGFAAVRDELQARYSTYRFLCDIERRIFALSQSVEEVARDLARGHKNEGEMIVQNVLIDGHNLAYRCFNVPAMSRLVDQAGRPTGLILGFLRSVGALKKRYPEASFWVAWDGSSQRRRAQYPDYKGKRKTRKETSVEVGGITFDPLLVLREVLPLMGVRQVWNAREEADDVIATLVRTDLEGQTNLILSTDRDFMQLVSVSTKLLYPSVGSRKEVLYDAAGVEHQMGVLPNKMLQLRALFGDDSDNLPGVPRVPKKVLKALIQEHGDVDGVYTTGLTTVNKGQYERLRGAEPQVRINLALMALQHVEISRVDPDVDEDAAARRLQDLDIKPGPILQAFFGKLESTPEIP